MSKIMENPFEILQKNQEQILDHLLEIESRVSSRETIEQPIDLKGACEHLGIGKTKMNEYLSADLIPCHRITGYNGLKFFKSELNDWVRSGGLLKLRKAS